MVAGQWPIRGISGDQAREARVHQRELLVGVRCAVRRSGAPAGPPAVAYETIVEAQLGVGQYRTFPRGRARDDRGKAVIVDAGGYRKKHIERLESLAEKMAEKCRETGEPVRLNPMSPFDRRIVHMALADIKDVKTQSDGEGEDRHIVVYPVAG